MIYVLVKHSYRSQFPIIAKIPVTFRLFFCRVSSTELRERAAFRERKEPLYDRPDGRQARRPRRTRRRRGQAGEAEGVTATAFVDELCSDPNRPTPAALGAALDGLWESTLKETVVERLQAIDSGSSATTPQPPRAARRELLFR